MSINTDYTIANGYGQSLVTTHGYCAQCCVYWCGNHDCQAKVAPDLSKYFQTCGTITVTAQGAPVAYSGSKPVVICNGQAVEVKDLNEAQSKAEQLAHQHQADAFILKPIKKVAPKREVITTEL